MFLVGNRRVVQRSPAHLAAPVTFVILGDQSRRVTHNVDDVFVPCDLMTVREEERPKTEFLHQIGAASLLVL